MRFGFRFRSPRAAISLMFALNGIVWGTWIARIPGVANHLDVSKSQLGSVLPAFAIGALIGFGLVGLGLSVILPITYRAAGSTPGISRGRAVASVATVGYLGFLAGPPIIGTVADAASLRGALLLVGVVTIALIPLSRSTTRPDPYGEMTEEDDSRERTPLPAHQTI